MHDEEGLHEEILEGLIKAVRMPLPAVQNPPARKEVFFPAHIMALCVREMWAVGYVQESERLLFAIMDTIQKQCLVTMMISLVL